MKYFKYAFGKIFLIVSGILVVLQIKYWNDARKQIKKERELLQQFIIELKDALLIPVMDVTIYINQKPLN